MAQCNPLTQKTSTNFFLITPQQSKPLEPQICGMSWKGSYSKLPDPEHVEDVFVWWYERRHIYPCLQPMALDYNYPWYAHFHFPIKSTYYVVSDHRHDHSIVTIE